MESSPVNADVHSHSLERKSDSSSEEGPAIPLLHTLRVNQSVAEAAAQC